MLVCYLLNAWFAAWAVAASGMAGRPGAFVSLCTVNGIVTVAVRDLDGDAAPAMPDAPLYGVHCPFCLFQNFSWHLPSSFKLSLPLPDAWRFAAIRDLGLPSLAPDWHHAPARAPPVFPFA